MPDDEEDYDDGCEVCGAATDEPCTEDCDCDWCEEDDDDQEDDDE